MRFSAIHKTATYLMSLAAWGSVLLGVDADPLLLLGLPFILLSWFLEPPRVKHETLAKLGILWNVATVALFVLTLMSILAGEPAVGSGIRFLAFLLVNKLCNRRASKDYQQIYVLTFLLLVAATTVNAELTYAVCFTLYVVFATWALTLFHLRREMEDNYLLKHSDDASSEKVEVGRILNSRRIVGKGFLAGTSLVSLGIFLGSVLLFVFFPRVGFGMFYRQGRSGLTLAGFSDGVRLGGHGVIKDNPAVVMRVEVSGPIAGRRAPPQHWRGVAFDQYRQGRWSRSEKAWPTHLFFRDDRAYVYPQGEKSQSLSELRRRAERGAVQKIYLEPLDSSALFGAGRPLAWIPARPYTPRGLPVLRAGLNDEVQLPHSSGVIYTVYSEVDDPDPRILGSIADIDPTSPRFRPYLQLPDEILKLPGDRVRQLARTITAGARGPYQKVTAIERYLRTNYTYTREQDTPDSVEPLDHFLHVRKKGHCEYFSTALAILARAADVPARNVNGFYGGEWNEYGDYFAVRSGDAHSWVEVYYDGVGWVSMDATPPGDRAELSSGAGGMRAKLRRWFDTLRLKWFKWVIEYDLSRQLSVFKGLKKLLQLDAIKRALRTAINAPAQFIREYKWHLIAGVLLTGALTAWLILRRRRRARALGSDARRRERRRVGAQVLALYERTLERLEKRGHARRAAETGREFARALASRRLHRADAFGALTELYLAARFGELAADEAEVTRLARELEDVAQPPSAPPAALAPA